MSKLTRVTQKLFGSSAGANQIAQFGSYAASSPTLVAATAISTIMSLTNWLTGWFGAVVGGNSPAIEDLNAVHVVFSYQLAYLMQAGIPEYDSGTTYYTGSLAMSAGNVYRSLQDNNTGNALTNANYWILASGLYAGVGSNGTVTLNPSSTPFYVVPAIADGQNIEVHTAQGPIVIFLPSPSLQAKITIIDVDGLANANPITLAVMPSFAWGDNTNYQAGVANPPSNQNPFGAYSSPVLVAVNPFTAMGIQSTASYFLDKVGYLWACGLASNGQLGTFDITPTRSVPTMVQYLSGATAVAAGGAGAYALIGTTGKIYAWGYNANGQVGDNTVLSKSLPTLAAGTSSYTAVVAGASHALALTGAGVVQAWGSNSAGQLGNNAIATVALSSPVAVVGSLPAMAAIGAGQNFSFGLTSSGTLYTWGLNTSGQLGLSSNPTIVAGVSSPVLVANVSFASVVAGDQHMLGITSSGTLYAWGSNTAGQLGIGNAINASSPTLVLGGKSWATVVAGIGFSAGLDVSGNLYVWGSNTKGILMSAPTLVAVSSPVLVTGLNYPAFSSLFAGPNSNTLIGMVNQGFYSIAGISASYVCNTAGGRWNVFSDSTNYWMR
jgi:alpha-tubulin suppressor-like RCC1 family protein